MRNERQVKTRHGQPVPSRIVVVPTPRRIVLRCDSSLHGEIVGASLAARNNRGLEVVVERSTGAIGLVEDANLIFDAIDLVAGARRKVLGEGRKGTASTDDMSEWVGAI
jgi:hypothetical protein